MSTKILWPGRANRDATPGMASQAEAARPNTHDNFASCARDAAANFAPAMGILDLAGAVMQTLAMAALIIAVLARDRNE